MLMFYLFCGRNLPNSYGTRKSIERFSDGIALTWVFCLPSLVLQSISCAKILDR